jgi:hypothetical protein
MPYSKHNRFDRYVCHIRVAHRAWIRPDDVNLAPRYCELDLEVAIVPSKALPQIRAAIAEMHLGST